MDITLKHLEIIRDALEIALKENESPGSPAERAEKQKNIKEVLKNIQDKILLIKETLDIP